MISPNSLHETSQCLSMDLAICFPPLLNGMARVGSTRMWGNIRRAPPNSTIHPHTAYGALQARLPYSSDQYLVH